MCSTCSKNLALGVLLTLAAAWASSGCGCPPTPQEPVRLPDGKGEQPGQPDKSGQPGKSDEAQTGQAGQSSDADAANKGSGPKVERPEEALPP